MAAIDKMHSFSKVSCFSKESRGRNDGSLKPLSWPFISQKSDEVKPRSDGKFRQIVHVLEQTVPLLDTEREFSHVDQSEKDAAFRARNCDLACPGDAEDVIADVSVFDVVSKRFM